MDPTQDYTQTTASHQTFANSRHAYNRAIAAAKKAKYDEVVRNIINANNSKSWFKYCKTLYKGEAIKESIPTLIEDGQTVTMPAEKAALLNRIFCQKASNIHRQPFPIIQTRSDAILEDITITHANVHAILKSLDTSKASGPDGIQNIVLKSCADSLSTPLVVLFRRSLLEGQLPAQWKQASVIPIFKNKGARSDARNYRPISLTSCVGKVMERLVNDAILQHLSSNRLITDSQFGFLPRHSTTDQLGFLLQDLHTAMNERKSTIACFLDLASAFDSVPHAGILHKLPAYGIRGLIFRWIANFLTNREQHVLLDDCQSITDKVLSGVPQGSVIAPTLFLLFMNDLSEDLAELTPVSISTVPEENGDHLMYADDTMIYFSGSDVEHLTQRMNQSLSLANQWANTWAMTFNHSKTNLMFFSNHANPRPVHFAGSPLEYVDTHRHLGFTISNSLSYSPHVDTVCRKVASQVFLLKRLAQRSNTRSILLQTYKSFILPLLEYASPIWAATTITDQLRLERLQRRAMRIILGYTYTQAVEDADYAMLQLAPLLHRRNFAAACLPLTLRSL